MLPIFRHTGNQKNKAIAVVFSIIRYLSNNKSSQILDRSNSMLTAFTEFVPSGMTNIVENSKNFDSILLSYPPTLLPSKKAFTLSEVLITLGVIGVVTAMTMPILIHNIQKFTLKQQFRRTYNTLSNAINKVYTDLEYIPLCSYGTGTNRTECGIFTKQFISNLNVVKKCTKPKEQGCIKYIRALYPDNTSSRGYTQNYIDNYNYTYILPDGSMIMLYSSGHEVPIYIIDVNGPNGPNKWGYDQYYFFIHNNKLNCSNDTIDEGGTKCSDMVKNF